MAITINQLNNILAIRLRDSNKVYWTDEEITRIIKESLLTFAAISGYWKRQVLIEAKNGQSFYNLLDSSDVKSGFEFIAISLVYNDIVKWIDDNLIGYSDIISLSEILDLITNAINIFQFETSLVLQRTIFDIQINQPVDIDDSVIDIIRAYYIDSSDSYRSLQLSSEERVNLIKPDYTLTSGKPSFFNWSNLSSSVIDLFPRPNENGFLELVHVLGKTTIVDSSSSCLIPNNLVPYIRFKILADIFGKDGVFKDPFREAYCLKRWQEGLLIGTHYGGIINKKLDGVNKSIASLMDFDSFRYNWLNDDETTLKKINTIATAGYNILALNKKPTKEHSLLLEIISNAPIEDLDSDINLQADYIPYILDYCVHLASIKDGIAAIQKTQPFLEAFIKSALEHNTYLQTMNISYYDLLQKSKYPLRQAKVLSGEENAA